MQEPEPEAVTPDANVRWTLQQIEESLHGLRYGQVTVIVQDGVVVQVERTERRRPPRPARRA